MQCFLCEVFVPILFYSYNNLEIRFTDEKTKAQRC